MLSLSGQLKLMLLLSSLLSLAAAHAQRSLLYAERQVQPTVALKKTLDGTHVLGLSASVEIIISEH